jgi:hypothetical protein
MSRHTPPLCYVCRKCTSALAAPCGALITVCLNLLPLQAADTAAGFANAAVRRGFMRKVLFIVLLQLIVTAGISLVFYYVKPLKVPPPSAAGRLAASLRSRVSMCRSKWRWVRP